MIDALISNGLFYLVILLLLIITGACQMLSEKE